MCILVLSNKKEDTCRCVKTSLSESEPSASRRRCPVVPRHSLCVAQTLCTWSRWVSDRRGSRCWSSLLHAGDTSAAAAAAPASRSPAWERWLYLDPSSLDPLFTQIALFTTCSNIQHFYKRLHTDQFQNHNNTTTLQQIFPPVQFATGGNWQEEVWYNHKYLGVTDSFQQLKKLAGINCEETTWNLQVWSRRGSSAEQRHTVTPQLTGSVCTKQMSCDVGVSDRKDD